MSEPIISISGLRGVIGTELTPSVAARFAAAFCSQLGPGPVALSRDGRTSGPMLADSVAAAITASGRECLDLDVASTPTVGVFVRTFQAAGAIQISASHNPPQYNGMKLFAADGRVVPSEIGNRVLEAYRNGESRWATYESIGRRNRIPDPHQCHLDRVLSTVQVPAIRDRGFRVLLDSNHGAGAILGERLLKALGCTVQVRGEVADGLFEHPPEPIAENLGSIANEVKEGKFDVGFCQDPDADRLAIIDAEGVYIGEEYTSVICMKRRLLEAHGPLVTNCASSNMTSWLAARCGVPFFRSKVGEANVVDQMLQHNALYGGEGSGGPIDPRVGFIRDSFVGIAQVLDLMAAENMTIAQIVESLPRYAMIKDKLQLSKEALTRSTQQLASELKADSISTDDGVRLDFDNAWLLLRGSNTEPIVRLIAEAESTESARELIDRAKSIISKMK